MRIRRDKTGRYPAPSQPTFSRMLFGVNAQKVEEAILAFQTQVRGKVPGHEMAAIDGKQPRHSQGQQILNLHFSQGILFGEMHLSEIAGMQFLKGRKYSRVNPDGYRHSVRISPVP